MITTGISISTSEILKLQKHIRLEVLKELKYKLKNLIPYVKLSIQEEVRNRIANSDTLRELQTGGLRFDLGLTAEEVSSIANVIPDIASKATNVRIQNSLDSIDIIVELISRGYEDLLALPQASYLQTYTTKEPKEIPWLSWLLTKGDTMVIGEFRVKYVDDKPYSRSGGAVMIKGGGFRIPPEFSGTEENNFLTKSLEGIDNFIFQEIVKYL